MKLHFIGFFGLIFIVVIMVACENKESALQTSRGLPVTMESVNIEELAKPVATSGLLTSKADLKLSFKIGGIIDRFNVKESQIVRSGQVLASLKLDEIAAQVAQARSGFEKASRDYKRAQNLYEDSVATLEQFQDAETGLAVAKANLEIAQFNLDHAKIIAPSDGRVLKQLAEANEMIGAGFPVLMFASGEEEWMIQAGVPDRDVVRLSVGDKAVVHFDVLPDQEFEAIVTEIAGGPNPMNGTYEVKLAMAAENQTLYNGFVANVTIQPSKKESYAVIPFEALVDVQGMKGFTFTITQDSMALKTPVSIQFLFDRFAAINTGLENVDAVVTEGAAYLIDGRPVHVVQN